MSEIINTNINLADNETIIFRVNPAMVLVVFQLIGLFLLAVILFIFFLNADVFGGFTIGFLSIQQFFFLISLLILVFVGAVAVLAHYTTFYSLTTRRVQKDAGILQIRSLAIPLDEVANLDTRTPFIGRILGFGDIYIRSDSSETNLIRFGGISNPQEYRELIEDNQPHGNVVSILGENKK